MTTQTFALLIKRISYNNPFLKLKVNSTLAIKKLTLCL